MIHKAIANPNIALIKYWGKVDEQLNLPATASISMTLDIFPTTTTVEINEDLNQDQVTLNGAMASEHFTGAAPVPAPKGQQSCKHTTLCPPQPDWHRAPPGLPP